MTRALLRGLALVEAVGRRAGTVSELARRLDLDKAVVSRLVADAEAGGWLVRRDGVVELGPRSAALGRSSDARELERIAAELAHALAGVTALDITVTQFAGDRGHLLAAAAGINSVLAETDVDPFPLFATAAGLTLAAGLDDADLDERLRQPLARYTERTVTDPAEIRRRISAIRAGGLAREEGEFGVGVGCIAARWPHPLAAAPTSIAVLGAADQVAREEALVLRVLRAAVLPNATRSTIVAAAAG